MPTPFMHLAFAQRAVNDSVLQPYREIILANWGPFLLGNVTPDARVSSGIRRADTHFFEYEAVIPTSAMTVMLTQNPSLERENVSRADHQAFIAGYVAHLAMDEVWCTDMLFPHFTTLWDGNFTSFQMLHMILGWMDARDRATLPDTQYPALRQTVPDSWLPFIPDSAIIEWRDVVAGQLAPGGHSKTLEILGQRIRMTEDEMREFIESDKAMNDYLWRKVPPEVMAVVEENMYERAIEYIQTYLSTKGLDST